MSLYWQQAVQNRGTAPQHGAQNHGQNNGDVTQWNSSATTGYWNQGPTNNGTEQIQYNFQHAPVSSAYHHGFAGHEAQSYPTAASSYSNSTIQHTPMFNEPHGTIQYYPVVSSVAFNYGKTAGFLMPHALPGYETAYTAGEQYQSAVSSERIPQVSSLSSIPEFETADIPVSATAPIQHVAPPVVSHVQEHPQVDLTVESVDQKQSSQVTPESSYSVDTFGSTVTKEQEKVKDDEWDDWEQTPREGHERSPNDVGSIVSEPAVMMHSDKSRETSVASTNDHIQNGYDYNIREEHERHVDVQPVAQVAPLIKNASTEPCEQPVARVGPVHQAFDQVPNIGRVAPTRSVQRHLVIETAEQQASDRSETTVSPDPALSYHEPARAPIPSVVTSEVATPIRRSSPEHHVEVDSENIESTNMLAVQTDADRVTPDTVAVLNGSSPGEAQATSTPLTEQREEERLPERRSSHSSVRDVNPPQHPVTTNGDHSDSTQGSFAFTRAGHQASYNQRYRGVKEKYLGHRSDLDTILQRMESRRTDTPKMARNNPLVDVSVGNRRAGLQISARGPSRADQSNSSFGAMADMDQSIDLGNNSVGYGDDFVDASRRSRLNRSRPSSRVGEDASFHRAHVAHGHHKHLPDMGYAPQFYGHHPNGRHQGRMSAMGIPYQNEYYQPQAMLYPNQRSHSTFDARSMERFQRAGGNMMKYDVYAQEDDDLDESASNESELEDEQGDSDDEMRAYNMHRAVNNSFSNYSIASHQRRGQQLTRHYGAEELYYFGLIRLDTAHVDNFFRRIPPPREFYTALNPMQKAAYLYFAVLFSKLYPRGVAHFHDQFNSEFYKHKSTGLPPHEAFIKVCKAMYDERQSSQQKAYEASQKQLFSDDRDSADGLSDRASVYDKDDDRASDIMSVDNTQRAPLKFSTPHAFTRFGPGGKKITVQPDLSVSVVHIDDVKTALRDNQSRRIIDAAYNFKGPLITGRIQNHSILLYIQNQIHRIRCSEVAKENPNSCDVIDCLLLWQLLETVVQQHGRVTGPDIARLLIAAGASTSRRAHSNHREKSATPSLESTRSSASVDLKAYERFTQFLLGGHVDEAVECAVRDGLYADAMVLVRRIFAGDERKLADIEARFLTTRPSSNPVMTLVSVASGQPAPVLTNPPIDDAGSWRSHAAIVLANLNTSHARETVYRLGRVLAKREYHAAADFCFLAVSLLSNFEGINVFEPLPESELEGNERQHVSLVHASLPDDEWDSTACRFGFSLNDFFATEIFDFAIRLAAPNYITPLQNSVEYQRRRLQYAQLLNSLGGFSAEAYRYLLSIASAIWTYAYKFSTVELTLLADLADSLRNYAPDDSPDTAWIANLREMILCRPPAVAAVSQDVHSVPVQENNEPPQISSSTVAHDQQEIVATESADYYRQQPAVPHEQETEQNPMSSRSRSESLATEARNWHEDRQDPIQISPRTSTATPLLPPVSNGDLEYVTSPPLDSYQTPRGRTGSHSSHSNKMGYGEQLCNTQQQHYAAASHHHEYEESPPDSVDTTSHESTPVRQQRDTTSSSSTTVTTDAWSSQPPQPPVLQQPPVVNQPAYHATSAPASQQNLSAPQNQSSTAAATNAQKAATNGLQKSGSNNSSGILSSFVNKLRKTIPLNDEMKLPDDKAPSIRWDPDQNKWVGAGVEEETVAAPPPKMDPAVPPSAPQSGMTGLRAARGGGGSRYFNPLADSNSTAAPVPAPLAPPSLPLSFNFIPTMPDDVDSVDPFSGESNPTVHGAEQAIASS